MDLAQKLQSRFYDKLATKPYCSNQKMANLIRSKSSAINYPYIQPNPPHLAAWLIFDCDHSNIHQFENAGLPYPNMICINKETNKHHVYYAIQDVYTTEKARQKPLKWLAAIERTFLLHLKADPGYAGLMSKNPFHDDWRTWLLHDHVYELAELDDYKDLIKKEYEAEVSGFGRNCDLFDSVRFWAYRNIHKYSSHTFADAVLSKAESLNQFAQPLEYSGVKSIAKSITRYTERNRSYFEDRYGRKIGLNPALDLKTKQSLGAEYSASIKSDSTQAKIRSAIDELTAKDVKPTQKAVAEHVGVSLKTVKRHWKAVKEQLQKRGH